MQPNTILALLAAALVVAGGLFYLTTTRAATAAAPAAAPELLARANAVFQAGEWADAAEAYETIARDQPDDGQAWFRLGYARHRLERYADAVPAYRRAHELGFAPLSAAFNLVRVHALLGQTDEAFRWLDASLALGFGQVELLQTDEPLAPLREDARFEAVLAQADRNARPCEYDPRYRQFDFWIGEWEVRDAQGTLQGTNRIEKLASGCALLESWTGGSVGHSLNYFDPVRELWIQVWADSTGGNILQEGTFRDGSMVLEGAHHYADGARVELFRGTWTPLEDGRVRQFLEQSTDGGQTWYVWFDGYYSRKE